MITKNILRENLIHQKSYEARKEAMKGGVYICSDKDEFTFVPLEQVMYEGVTLKEYFEQTKKQTEEYFEIIKNKTSECVLENVIKDILLRLETYEQAIKVLADEIDKKR